MTAMQESAGEPSSAHSTLGSGMLWKTELLYQSTKPYFLLHFSSFQPHVASFYSLYTGKKLEKSNWRGLPQLSALHFQLWAIVSTEWGPGSLSENGEVDFPVGQQCHPGQSPKQTAGIDQAFLEHLERQPQGDKSTHWLLGDRPFCSLSLYS